MTIAQRIRNVTKVDGFGGIASQLLPFALLLLALSTVLVFRGDRGHFYRPGHHDYTSAEHLAVAVNLSPEHNFARFRPLTLDAEGQHEYPLYGRYPIGGYAVIKLATLPFGGSLSAQLYAARVLLLLFFAAAAVMAYLSLSRLTSSRWVALAAVLLGFSSFYFLYYNDMINVEVSIDFFGVMLTFHGMVVFMQDGRFRQLLVKACIALLFGWHVYALLLPFIILGMGSDLIKARSSASSLPIHSQLMRASGSLLRSRYLLLGVVSLLFGLCVLGSIFASEYYALDGERSLSELPIFSAIVRRTGGDEVLTEAFAGRLAWGSYLERQFQNIFRTSLPYVFLGPGGSEGSEDDKGKYPEWTEELWGTFLGVAAYGACIVGLAFARHKILLATLSSFGFFWAAPMRHNVAFHDFESWYYGGIPLALFSLILMYVHKRAGFMRFLIESPGWRKAGRRKGARRRRWIRRELAIPVTAVLSIVAALVFGASSFQMAKANHDLEMVRFHEVVVQDFEVIRKMTKDKVVFVHQRDNVSREFTGVQHGVDYYLSGSVVLYNHPFHQKYRLRKFSDYLVTGYRVDGPSLLTPDNRVVFLYDRRIYDAEIERMIRESGDPVFKSNFDVHYDGSTLTYSKGSCDARDTAAEFFLHVYPVDTGDLPSDRRQEGRDAFAFDFNTYGWKEGNRCFAARQLPSYNIARIHTGQFDANGRIWQGEFDLEGRGNGTIRESDGPVFQSNFDVYFAGSTLIYTKESCEERDAAGWFFLHVYPVDTGDLPIHLRREGLDNLNFTFKDRGGQTEDRCFAARQLPPYDVDRIHTGQFDANGRIWEGVFDLEGRDLDRMIADSGDPAIRSNFDVYLDGSTIIYTRDSCDEKEAATRFFLHVYPVDTGDLLSDRRQERADILDFSLITYDREIEGRCFAARRLPLYDIDRIHTGQFDSNGRIWEGVFDGEGRDMDRMIADAGDPVIQSKFDVYLDGSTIIYTRDSCGESDVDAQFFLHVYPADTTDLPSDRRQHGFDNLDFDFNTYGSRIEDRWCFATRQIPPYDVDRIHTGQFDSNGRIWQGVFDGEGRDLDRMIEDSGGPVIQSKFDVYLDGSTIIYTRDSCGESDVDAQFFLHVYPADTTDLPSDRRQHGFDNLDFDFNTYGSRIEDRWCFATRQIPPYDVDRIHTGQFDSNGRIWQGVFDGEGRDIGRMIEDSGGPAIQSNFDVYLDGRALIYARESCGEGDVDAEFFLHVYPADVGDLPSHLRQEGRDIFDFDFNTYGWRIGDRCFAVRQIPPYDIDRIHTGQFDANGRIWQGEFDAAGNP